MTWNVIQRYGTPEPWDDFDGNEWQWEACGRLSEQDFWQWMARTHGRLIARRAWDDYFDPETWDESRWKEPGWRPTLRSLRCFDGILGATENWMFSTNEDERYERIALEIENDLTFRDFMGQSMAFGRVLLAAGGGTPDQRETWVRELYQAEYGLKLLRKLRPEYSRHLDRLEAEREAVA